MFSPRSLPSNAISLPQYESVDDEPSPPSRWSKRQVRACVDFLHLLTTTLLLAGVSVAFEALVVSAWALAALWFTYLLPPLIFTILLELFHLKCGYTPAWATKKFGRFLRLGSRAIFYMVVATFVLAVGSLRQPQCHWCSSNQKTEALVVLGLMVLILGFVLFILAWVAEGCGFTDWVEEPAGREVEEEEEEEPLPDLVGSPAEEEHNFGTKGL